MPDIPNVDYVSWFNSASVPANQAHEPVHLVATGNCLTGRHKDDDPPVPTPPPPTMYIPTPWRQVKGVSMKGITSGSLLSWCEGCCQFVEGLINKSSTDSLHFIQNRGDSVSFPARNALMVISVDGHDGWNALMHHNIRNSPAAVFSEIRLWNVTTTRKDCVSEGHREERGWVTKEKWFAARKQSSSTK